MLCIWFFTVAQLIVRSRAISLLERPSSASARISLSRTVSAGSDACGLASPKNVGETTEHGSRDMRRTAHAPIHGFDQRAQQFLSAAFARDITGKARRCASEDAGIDLVQCEGHKLGIRAGAAHQPRGGDGVGLAEIDQYDVRFCRSDPGNALRVQG